MVDVAVFSGVMGTPASGTTASLSPISGELENPDTPTGRVISLPLHPLGGMSADTLSILTNIGRTRCNQIQTDGLRFGNFEFQVGRGGYSPSSPHEVTVPDPDAQALIDPIFPSADSYEPVDRIEHPNAGAIAFLCRLERGECLHPVGELGVFAKVTAAGTSGLVVGSRFLLALAHFPARYKAAGEVMGYRIPLQIAS